MVNNIKTLEQINRQELENFINPISKDINSLADLKTIARIVVEHIFNKGKNKKSNESKNFTGAALEVFGTFCLKELSKLIDLNFKVDKEYLYDDTGEYDKIRLDDHVSLDGRYIVLQESRVWLDKPFCTLKYQVIEDFLFFEHSRAQLDKNIIFPILTICNDTLPITKKSRDHFLNSLLNEVGMPVINENGRQRVEIFSLSKGKRSDGYFSAGINYDDIESYIDLLYSHFNSYKND